jgi:hypothetical protein
VIDIRQGDALTTEHAGDVLITDPVWPNCPPDSIAGSEDPWGLWRAYWAKPRQYKRAVVVMRHDSDPRFLSAVPMPFARCVILPYVMPGYIGRWLGGDEIAYCFGEPVPSAVGRKVIPGRAPAVQPDGRRANGHPMSRALKHMEFLVHWWSDDGETVVDPFMGSGTTAVACVRLGRRFVGIDIEQRWVDLALDAIKNEERAPRLLQQGTTIGLPLEVAA